MTAAEGPLFSPYWYKLSGLCPRLRPGVQVTRRIEQGEVWHILSAPETNRHFRLDAAAYAVIGALDGRHSLDQIWHAVLNRFGDDAPGQDETIRLLGQLHQADALNAAIAPTMDEFGRRARRTRRQKTLGQLKNPMFFRIPLVDPDRFLTRTLPLVRPLFTRTGFAIWAGIMAWLLTEVVRNWGPLSAAVIDRALAVDNLAVALLVFPVAKAVHELAHGWAVKIWGGEVREMGIMFLVFLPAPYVDASASSAFAHKHQRIIVAAAGMMAEAVLAALAMYLWLRVETGLVSALAFNTLLVAGISTLLFNGNPLLRFDAYFMLGDTIGVQNLAGRSGKWWGWVVHRFGFGLERWENPARTPTETGWFAAFHPVSYAYRVFLTLTIALFVADSYPVIGLGLAVWAVTTTFAVPFGTALWAVATGPRIARHRPRALAVTAALIAAPLAALMLIPVPHGTVVPAVVAEPADMVLTAPAEAEIARLDARAGAQVGAGDRVARLTDPLLASEVAVADARIRAVQAQMTAEESRDGAAGNAAASRAELGFLIEEATLLRADLAALAVTSPRAGQLVAAERQLLPGRRYPKGADIGFIIPPDMPARLRAAVPADRVDLVRAAPAVVQVRMADRVFAPIPGTLLRIAPEARRDLLHPALSTSAGGPLDLDPNDPDGQRTVHPTHEAEIAIALPMAQTAIGARAWIRFDHGPSPLAPRLWRAVRQLFLSRLAL